MKNVIGMKDIFRIVALAMFLAGCTQQENIGGIENGMSPIFTASFEDALSKTYLDGGHKLLWTADDRLSIFMNTYNQQYRYMGESGRTSADFEEVKVSGFHSGNTLGTNYAVYPYRNETEIANDGTLTLNFPSVQTYARNSFGPGANTMVAVTESPDEYFLAFKNLCGYLVVRLYGEGSIRSISLRGNNEEKLAGTATVVAVYGEDPVISMSGTATDSITIDCGEAGVTIGTTIEEATEFWFCIPPVTFSQGFNVIVSDIEGKNFNKGVSSSKTIHRNVINSLSALEVELTPGIPTPERVDLGLSVEWASFNVGASKTEESGGYYQWGGTDDITCTDIWAYWDNCPFHTGTSYHDWTKYVPLYYSSYWSGSGDPDNKMVLDPEDDIAHVKLGGKWRMPTEAEWNELLENCTWTWTDDYEGSGIAGSIVSRKMAGDIVKSIFLPATGMRYYYDHSSANLGGYYWSSSISGEPIQSWAVSFCKEDSGMSPGDRFNGYQIRPVYGDMVKVSGVTLNKTEMDLSVGSGYTLKAAVAPMNAADKGLRWSSSASNVVTVDAGGNVCAVNFGEATITVRTTDGGYTSSCHITVSASYPVPEAIDLGLPSGLKWGSFNLGASKPEEYGAYYQWAGLEAVTGTSENLDFDKCPYHIGPDENTGWMKYVPSAKSSYWSGAGSPDNKTNLDLEDDVAHVMLGGKWRMPTIEEFHELFGGCYVYWATQNGVGGYVFQSMKNINSIFLPAAGYRHGTYLSGSDSYGEYWSSSLWPYMKPSYAYRLAFSPEGVNAEYGDWRYCGLPLRPVSE